MKYHHIIPTQFLFHIKRKLLISEATIVLRDGDGVEPNVEQYETRHTGLLMADGGTTRILLQLCIRNTRYIGTSLQ